VRYNFTLTKRDGEGSNAYKDVYALDNRGGRCRDGAVSHCSAVQCGEVHWPGGNGGGNPEDTSVETAWYRRHWRENWLSDSLTFSSGENILLLQDFQFKPSNCGRHVGTFRKSRTAFIANKSGPLRAVRSWVGANSGTLTQRDSLMYEAR
jgi:hypothetical protein